MPTILPLDGAESPHDLPGGSDGNHGMWPVGAALASRTAAVKSDAIPRLTASICRLAAPSHIRICQRRLGQGATGGHAR